MHGTKTGLFTEAMAGMPEKAVMETVETGAKEETEGMEMDMAMEVTPEKGGKEAKGDLMVA
ncbi:hypothetical protein QCB07_004417 [Salmonella enterica]|nr:hypothetical protein [Salmonella enterica]